MTRVSFRALLAGAIWVIILNIAAPYEQFVLHSTLMATNYFPFGVMLFFLITVVILNPIAKLLRSSWAFSPAELIIIFIMLYVGAAIPTYGLTGYLTGVIAAPFYFATSENRWAETFHQYIPSWIAPHQQRAIRWFYEGLPPGESIPWGAWAIPLIWWLPFIGAVLFVCLALITILRKQWVEKEKLAFPLAQIPLDMTEGADDRRICPVFMRNWLFWIGFGVPFLIILWNIAGYFNPVVPTIQRSLGELRLGYGFPPIPLRITPFLIGIVYLIQLDVSLSLWLFVLLAVIETGIFRRIGFTVGTAELYASRYEAAIGWQAFGGMLVMVLWGLWVARPHLRDVIRKAFGENPSIDDSGEIMSYRTAVLGMMVALAYMVFWMRASGLSLEVILIFLVVAYVLYLGVTRIVIEGGLIFLRGPITPQAFIWHTVGSCNMTPQSITAMGFSFAWFSDIIATFMPFGAHAAKLGHARRLSTPTLLTAIIVTLVVGISVSLWFTLYLGYHHGAYNFGDWVYRGGSTFPWDIVTSKIREVTRPDIGRIGFLAIGAAVVAFLTYCRYRFLWWPLHPIGFTICSVLQVNWTMFSIFVGWLTKFVILKIGGYRLFRKAWPFFLGLILGHFAGAGVSLVVDIIWFFGQGHSLYL